MALSGTTVCNYATGSGLSIAFHPTPLIPRTDPTNPSAGATVLFLLAFATNAAGDSFTTDSITDDATPGSCLTDDGLNKYTPSLWAGDNPADFWMCSGTGLIVNDLSFSNTITMNLLSNGGSGGPADFILLIARAYTGCLFSGIGPFSNITGFMNPGATAFNGGVSAVPTASRLYAVDWELLSGSPSFFSPLGAGPSTWQFLTGELAVYIIAKSSDDTTNSGSFTWDNTNIDDLVLDLAVASGVGGRVLNFSWAEQTVSSTPDVGELVTGTWDTDVFDSLGQGIILQSGNGPTCSVPTEGSPCFNNRIRLIA